jgi:hypothetical protein
VLDVFREVLRLQPHATLTLLTKETGRARDLCNERHLMNVTIRSVPAERVVSEMRAFSFGFIIRREMLINRVSTPTKLSSYLAAGVIPVVTSATPALLKILQGTSLKVEVRPKDEPHEIAAAIVSLYEQEIASAAVHRDYSQIFTDFFDDRKHVAALLAVVRRRLCL